MVPFFILGIAVKLSIQENVNRAWEEQKNIWQQFFTLAPNIAPGTQIVILLPEYNESMSVPPIQGGHMAYQFALSMFYEDESLRGDFLEGELTKMEFSETGLVVRPGSRDEIFDYKRTIIFLFDPADNILHPLINIPPGLVDQYHDGIKLCDNCILPDYSGDNRIRWLVH
jgi:hypothetical protein